MAIGAWRLFTLSYEVNKQKAVDFMKPFGFTTDQAIEEYEELHINRLSAVLGQAVYDVLGDSPMQQYIAEHPQKGDESLRMDAREMWIKIVDTFEKKTGFATVAILDDLQKLHYQRNENPTQFKQRFDSLILKLNEALRNDEVKEGEKVSEGMKLAYFLKAMPRGLDSTVQGVLSAFVGDRKPTVDAVFQSK